ncbi:DUF3857 domain-containing protein [Flavobacterium sp.]|uniref:DUF3857 domain-containing protein n=1 Tax=Flavobacterium sp. TaxID=239 RepID=UPI002FDE8071
MKKVIIIYFLLVFQIGFSQKIKLGAVTIEELKEKTHPKDSSSAAAYIFKKGTTNFHLTSEGSWEITTEVDIKIKVYKKEGFEFANQSIPYYVGSNKERVTIYEAYTYNLVDGKIEKTKLKSEGEFKEELNERWNLKKITFPSVKEGSIIEYRYRIVSPYISNFSDWYFQYNIPVNYVQYEAYIPQYFVYRTVITGYENIVTEEKYMNGSDYNSTKYTYIGKDVIGLKEEEFVKNIDNYTSKLKFELASINYPNKPTKNVSLNWEDVSKSIYENDDFGKELNYKSYFDTEINALVKENMNENEKMDVVFSYVQKIMNWNKNNGYNCEYGVKRAFKEKTGNVADINLMLVAMLRFVGLNANPIIISTTSNGIAIFPSRLAFNYVIAGVKLQDGNLILLDATSKNTYPNIIPIKAINWFGRMLLANGTSVEVDLNPKKASTKNITILAEIKDHFTIEGKTREVLTDYNALQYREKFGNVNKISIKENLEKKYNGIEIDELVVKNEMSKPVTINYSFISNNSAEIIGDKLFVSPLLFMTNEENPFKSEKRSYPVEFDFPQKVNYNISLKISENYVVEFIPSSILYKTPGGELVFNFSISNTNNVLQISSSLEINSTLISAQDYSVLKLFFKEMINKQTEKIILKKN